MNSPLDGRNVRVDRLRPGESDNRLHDGKRVAGAVIDLARQQRLALLRLLAVGDVDDDAAHAGDAAAGRRAGSGGADAPAHFAVRALDAELGLEGLRILEQALPPAD